METRDYVVRTHEISTERHSCVAELEELMKRWSSFQAALIASTISVTPAAAQETTRSFATPAGIMFNVLKPDRVNDLTDVITAVVDRMQKSADRTHQAQAKGWKIVRVHEPDRNGNVTILYIIDPAVPGADYSLLPLLKTYFPDQWEQMANRLAGAYASQSIMSLHPVVDYRAGKTFATPQPTSQRTPPPAAPSVAAAPTAPSEQPTERTLPPAFYESEDGAIRATITSRVTQKTDAWWEYTWSLAIANKGNVPRVIVATIEFQDVDSSVLDTSTTQTTTVPAGSEQTLTGLELIDAKIAPNVVKNHARVKFAK